MLNGLASALGWQPSALPPPGQSVLIKASVEYDAFVFSYNLMTFYMKAGVPVVIFSVKEPLAQLVGLFRRLGHDLHILEAQNRFKYVDASAMVEGSIGAEEALTFVEMLPRALVVLDDITLMQVGKPLQNLFSFWTRLQSIPQIDTAVAMTGSDEGTLFRWLKHRASLTIDAHPLSSGLSRELHGELIVKHGGRSYLCPSIPDSRFLFKFSEASIFFSPKGT